MKEEQVRYVVVVHGVVVRRTQQSSSVHPVAAQTGLPGTFVQSAGGHVKEEQVRCVVVVVVVVVVVIVVVVVAAVVVVVVVVRRTQQSSSVHPVAAQTGTPSTFVQGAGGHVKEEQVRCVVVVHGVVVRCTQQSSPM